MKWNCNNCGKEFEIKIEEKAIGIAIAFCEDCGKEIEESLPKIKEYVEEIKGKKNNV